MDEKRVDGGRGTMHVGAGVLLGGTWGGVIVGLVEAGLIATTAGPADEYWLFPYAVVSYGLFGMLLGVGCVVPFAMLAAIRRRPSRDLFAASASVAFFALGAVVARYQVIQRIFHEELVMVSALGLLVHLGIVVAVGVLALGILAAGRVLQRNVHGSVVAALGLIVCLVASSSAALLTSTRSSAAIARTTSPTAKGHPNIILIIADTLRADALGCYGAGAGVTPALDQFATESVRFANTYSQATWTRPSIATILTSLYPSVHSATHKMDALPGRVTTLAEALRSNGYWTAGFVSNINVAPVFNFQQGFDEYVYLEPSFYFWATDSATRLAIYKGLREVRERLFRDRIYFYNYYQDAQVVDTAVANWLGQHPPDPFFLFIHFMDPHDPYFEIPYDGHGVARVSNPNPPAARKDELHGLYNEDVKYLDRYLGMLFERLKAQGLYDDSIIALTADHGEEFQEHGGWWHGTSLYQEQMHVPLLLKRAHEPRNGQTDARLARSLDIAPTLMTAARLAPPREFAGEDLFGPLPSDSSVLFAEEDLEGNVLTALRLGSWKIISANPDNPRGLKPVELYDLSQDPGEHQNLATKESARVEQMLQQLGQERARIHGRAQMSGDLGYAADRRS